MTIFANLHFPPKPLYIFHGGKYNFAGFSRSKRNNFTAIRCHENFSPDASKGVGETFEGITADPFDTEDPWIYACDSFQLRLIRIHSQTGVREVVATDPVLFNFPVKVQFLPPVFGLKPLVVASDQEHRLAAINAALSADITQPPWIVTKMFVFGQQ